MSDDPVGLIRSWEEPELEISVDVLRSFYGWSKETRIEDCSDRAYMDLRRTMNFDKINNTDKKKFDYDKKQYRNEVNKLISGAVSSLLAGKYPSFDGWHDETCDAMIKMSCKNVVIEKDGFTYGQAQKWLNMTIKNMMICGPGGWDDGKLNNFRDVIHVPVDSYILIAASAVRHPKLIDAKVELPKVRVSGLPDRAWESIKWSTWNEPAEYKEFQVNLREAVKQAGYSAIEWEFDVWPKVRDAMNKKERR